MNDLETRLTAALTDTAHRSVPDSLVPPAFRPDSLDQPRQHRWLVPVLAAAVVVALAVGALLGVQRLHQSGSTPPATSPERITFHTQGNVELSQDQLRATARTVSARLVSAGIDGATVSSLGSDQLVVSGSLTTAQIHLLPGLMVAGALQFRPLITMPFDVSARERASGGLGRTVDPWASLGFTPPADPAQLATLTSAQRQAVLNIVKSWDCRNVSVNKADTPIISCDQGGSDRYLLGPTIVDAGQVKQAVAVAPGTVDGQLEWTVDVDLKPVAQQAWADYTAKHNESDASGAVDNQVADVVDGKLIVASTIQSTITGTTQITGSFTETTAQALAAALNTDPLPVAFVP